MNEPNDAHDRRSSPPAVVEEEEVRGCGVELLWLAPDVHDLVARRTDWLARPRRSELDEWLEQPDSNAEADGERTAIARLLESHPAAKAADLERPWRATANRERPLLLVRGSWQPSFDERETLRATMAAVHPFSALDRRLKESLDQATELLGVDWRATPAALESATSKLRDAYAQVANASPPLLDALVERQLLERRAFSKRTLAGGNFVRGHLHLANERDRGVPCYLPEAAANELPLLPHLPVATICEHRPQQEARDVHRSALFVQSLARVVG